MFFRQTKSHKRGAASRQTKTQLGHEQLEERALLAVFVGDVVLGDVETFAASGVSLGTFSAQLAP